MYMNAFKLFSLLWDIVEVFYNMKFLKVLWSLLKEHWARVYLISRRSAGLNRGGPGWKQGVDSLWNLLMVGNWEPGGNSWMEAPKESPGRLSGRCVHLWNQAAKGRRERSVGRRVKLLLMFLPHITFLPFSPFSLEPLPNLRSHFYAQLLAYSHLLTPTSPFLISDSGISFCRSGVQVWVYTRQICKTVQCCLVIHRINTLRFHKRG